MFSGQTLQNNTLLAFGEGVGPPAPVSPGQEPVEPGVAEAVAAAVATRSFLASWPLQ